MSQIAPIKNFAGMNLPTEKISVQNFEKKQKDYTDPLMKWPVRGMAFTNDIGAAIMDIAPKAGTIFWIPALMYFGADIYDKYRNDKESYDPSAKRGLQQALFQTFASIIFPIAAVHTGQKAASIIARSGKRGLSLQTQEEIINHHTDTMMHFRLRETKDIENYKKSYSHALDNYIDETMRSHKYKNPLKLIINLLFGHKHPEQIGQERQAKVHEFIGRNIDDIFEVRKDLLENKKPEKLSNKLFIKFLELKKLYKKDSAHVNDYVEVAAKDTLKAMENSKVFKIKILKTIGGFAMLGLLVQPIDKFVEDVIIKKLVEPKLEKYGTKEIKEFKEKVFK